MGRKKKYATPEEARKGNNEKRTKRYLTINHLDEVKASVEEAPEHIKDFANLNKNNHDMFSIDQVDIYQYALIGVDQTIHTLVLVKKYYDKLYKTGTTNQTFPTRKRLQLLLLQQLRFRSWLIDKAHLAADLITPFDYESFIPNYIKKKKYQTQQEEEEDANTTAFTESDPEQEGTL